MVTTRKSLSVLNPNGKVEPRILRYQAGVESTNSGVGYLCGNGSKTAGGETSLRGEISDTPARGHFSLDAKILSFLVDKFRPFVDEPDRFYGYSARKLMMKMGLSRRDSVRVKEVQTALKLLKQRGWLRTIHVRPSPRFVPTLKGIAAADNGGV